MPSMRIVRELTVGLGESVTPNTPFTQSWMIENNGDLQWPQECYLKLVSATNNDEKMYVPAIAPRDTHIITINLVSPAEIGQFKSQFCLCTPSGLTFGQIWSVIDVSLSGTISLTQQLTQLHTSSQIPKANSTQQSTNNGWDEEEMVDTSITTSAMNQSTALVPHCSNNSNEIQTDPFPIINQVSDYF
jgi:hypothetical protein